jgi:hypothetical protein
VIFPIAASGNRGGDGQQVEGAIPPSFHVAGSRRWVLLSEQARRLIWQAERAKLTVLTVYAQSKSGRDFSLVIEPVEGRKEFFADALKAHIAVAEWSAEDVRESLRYFELGEDGIPRECKAERWKMNSFCRKGIEIPCSPKVTALIHFVGLASPYIDEKVAKLWAVNLNFATELGSYGSDLFSTFEEAKTFVDEYKAKGCPSGSALRRFRTEYYRRHSSRKFADLARVLRLAINRRH